jgi:cytochrome P450
LKQIPGPRGLPGLGVGPSFQARGCEYLTDLASQYGKIVNFPLPGIRGVLVSDKNLVKQILIQTERQFYKGQAYDILKPVVGEGLVTTQGAPWRQQRKLLNPLFQKKEILSLDPVLDRAAEQLKKTIQTAVDHGEPLQTTSVMMEFTFTVLVEAFFSGELDRTQYRDLSKGFQTIQQWIGGRFVSLVRPPLGVPTPANLKLRRAKKLLMKVITGLLETRCQQKRRDSRPDLLDFLLESKQPQQQIIDELVTFLIAGHDTTALTLSYTCALLAENPAVRNWLASDMGRLQQCLLESMRIYPAVWAINRNNREAFQYAGYEFKPDTTFFVSQFAVHRDPEYWPEPLLFKPERFASGEPDDFSFFPFAGGPRTCIGNHLAMVEALGVLQRVFPEYLPVKLERDFKVLPQLTAIPDPEILIRWEKVKGG